MITTFENFLRELSASSITNIFFWVLFIVFVLGLLLGMTSARKAVFGKNLSEYAPTLLTSLGILGTFTGIVSGLLNFNIDAIDSSISELLSGMKTAFLTSVIGVGLSILLKICYTFRREKIAESNSGLEVEKVIENFYEQTSELKNLNKNIDTVIHSIGGDKESSLTSQLKLLRADINDNHKVSKNMLATMDENLSNLYIAQQKEMDNFIQFSEKLWIKLQDFADMMSKSATEAVIEALKQVIQDFNNNLTEQFGDNFKQLNEAVKLLVEWQENYKRQLNEMISLYQTAVATLSATEASIVKIENSTQAIPVTMNNLDEIISTNQQQLNNLAQHLDSFAQLRDKAVEAVPEIQRHITLVLDNVEKGNRELLEGLSKGSEQIKETMVHYSEELSKIYVQSSTKFAEHLQESSIEFREQTQKTNELLANNSQTLIQGNDKLQLLLKQSAQTIEEQNQEMAQYFKGLSEQILQFSMKWNKEFDENTKRIQERFKESVEAMVTKQVEENKRLMSRLESESENALKLTGESINKQFKTFDEAVEIELKRVIGDMGKALASIADRFTQDYQRLVDEMNKVVNYGNKGRF